jgi:cytochrome P450
MTDEGRLRRFPSGEYDGLGLDPMLAELRADEPLAKIRLPFGRETWLVTRYRDARKVVTSKQFSRARESGPDAPRFMASPRDPHAVSALDAPDHTRVRKLAGKAFTPKRIEMLRGNARKKANELVDEFAGLDQPADFMRCFGRQMPLAMLTEMMGIPREDFPLFHQWIDDMEVIDEAGMEKAQRALKGTIDYLAGQVAERMANPHDDLLADMVAAREGTDRLTEEQLVHFAFGLWFGGLDTTFNLITNGFYLLLTHPEQLALLLGDQSLIPAAVDEFLRYAGVSGVDHARMALSDVELSTGTIPAGDAVVVSLPSANRDESVFTNPDEVDITRTPNHHLAFSGGMHYCIGAPLARMEMSIALDVVLNRLPGLRLAITADEVPWAKGKLVRRPEALPVRWDQVLPAASS